MTKYKLIDKTTTVWCSQRSKDITLRRIQYSDGTLGGFLESENNLSQFGNCRVLDNAQVYGDALVSKNARVSDNALVSGNARVSDNARVYGDSIVTKNPLTCQLTKHHITCTDNTIAVGCECHSFDHWERNIEDIGKKHGYTDNEIEMYKYFIKGMINIRKKKNEKERNID